MTDAELDRLIEAMARLLGIELAAAWRPGVRLHLGVTAAVARPVLELALDDEAEPAPVFEA